MSFSPRGSADRPAAEAPPDLHAISTGTPRARGFGSATVVPMNEQIHAFTNPRLRRRTTRIARAMESIARSPGGYWYVQKVARRIDPPLLRLTGGRVSSLYPYPVMLLTTVGAKTGLPRALPLAFIVDGDSLILIASNYGKSSHPAWYRNLVANPEVDVLAGARSGRYSAAEITDPAERDRAWDLVDFSAGYSDYEVRAGNRKIPTVRLQRTGG